MVRIINAKKMYLECIINKWRMKYYYYQTHVGTALIVEWLNVKIQNRMAPPSPTPNESSKQAEPSQNKEETYRFQVRFILTFNKDCSITLANPFFVTNTS